MKPIKLIIYIISMIVLANSNLTAQPYIYFQGSLVDSSELNRNYWLYNINRLNLSTGEEELFLYNGYCFEYLTWDPTQTWLIVDYCLYESSNIFSCHDTLVSFDLPEGITGSKENYLYSSEKNKIYIIGYHDSSLTLDSYNLTTKQIDNSIPILREDIYNDEGMFFSSDKEKIYLPVSEPGTQREQVMTYSTSTEQIITVENLENYGYSNANAHALYEGRKGKAIIGSFSWSDTTEYIRFFDFDTHSGSAFIIYKGDATPYYINDDYFILADNSFDPTDRSIYNSGNIHIYNIKTAKFVKTINFPPRGKIYTFDNYPDYFYYVKHLQTNPQIFAVNIDSILNEEQGSNHNIKLLNSTGTLLTGGSLQYYEGAWKDAVNNGDGTFLVSTSQAQVSLRMTYEYGTQTLSNVSLANGNVAVFQTINAEVKLQDSNGSPIDTGTVQYYAGAWREFGSTTNGTANKELLPNYYSFRMTYENASNDKQQNISTNLTVVFQTVNAAVELRNSSGTLMDAGTVQYYAGAWREFGSTTNGTANKELLPNNYSFRMTYANSSNDKQQNIGTNPTVVFQTVNAAVELRNSLGTLMDAGTVQYYAGAWREFGSTTNGTAYKELLPNNYSFRMTYANSSNDKQQNIGTNTTITFQTVNAAVELRNSTGALMDAGTVQYYAGAWREFGITTNGTAYKELLPNNYSFRMTHAFSSVDKQQNIGTNPSVAFQTVNAAVELRNSTGTLMDAGTVQYYAGAWREFGSTTNGTANKELLPNNYSFRMTHEYISNDKQQNIGTNNPVIFTTTACKVTVKNTESQLLDNADIKYYAGAWRPFGITTNGEAVKELLPANLSFRAAYNGSQKDKVQNTATNSIVEFVFP